jgi:molybdopterin-containing oxidoreductase family iron-sulfur binding subunit
MVLFLVKEMLGRGRGNALPGDTRSKLLTLTREVNADLVELQTGVSKEKILLVADYLAEADASLVLAGGTATSTADPLPLLVAVNFLNMVLGNVGKTINVAEMKQPASSAKNLTAAIDDMQKGKVDVLFVCGTNPGFTFPDSFGFDHAVNQVGVQGEGSGKGAGLVVALTSHLDETAQLADYILPINTNLEDWGYVTTPSGAISLIQPSMRPIFDTRSAGDVLMTIGSTAGKSIGGDAKSFDAFIKASFLKATAGKGHGDADTFWMSSLEKGGYFPEAPSNGAAALGTVDASAYGLSFKGHTHKAHGDELLLYPYPSVKSFDGRAANRPWMQELPDPITQAVWGSWAEMHSKTAKRLHLAHGDALILRTDDGEVQVPVYVSDYVHEDIVAVPLGQGHSAYGRYAKSAGKGNVYSLLPKQLAKDVDAVPLLGVHVKAVRGLADGGLVVTQEFSSQVGRDLAKTTLLSGAAASAAHATGHQENGYGSHDSHGAGGHGEHEEVKQMYHQREHPLYQWGMTIDLAACTGCSACVVACYAENNIPVVGKKIVSQGREMSWLRIERYYDSIPTESGGEELKVSFLPMLCQHCQNAPCEPVCPVYATYHNEEGMNAMIYNRCVGTRYCSNNCSYKVRRFNWFQYEWPELLDWQVNPDVTKRTVGIMEKCTFCVQRIAEAKDVAKDLGRSVEDGEITPACVQTCPTQALTFGNLKDPNSRVSKLAKNERAYKVLDHHLNTQPSISYLEDIRYKA